MTSTRGQDAHNEQLISPSDPASNVTNFVFSASDPALRGGLWANTFWLILIGVIITLATNGLSLLGILLIVIGVVLCIVMCALECPRTTCHTLSFLEDVNQLHLYKDNKLQIAFARDSVQSVILQVQPRSYCTFCCFLRGFSYGQRYYCAGQVIIVFSNGSRHTVNHKACVDGEIQYAKLMVQKINRYLRVRPQGVYRVIVVSEQEQKQPRPTVDGPRQQLPVHENEGEEGGHAIAIGSCCYVDCESVRGVVVGHLPGDCYLVVDLFEKTERRASGMSLTVITDENVKEEVQAEYQHYLNGRLV